jgi:phenylalanyl-tRNA synthetase alpha chain
MSQDIVQLIAGLHPLEKRVLMALKTAARSQWETELLQQTDLDEARLSMALGWLQAKSVVSLEREETATVVSLTEIGEKYKRIQIPELRLIKEIRTNRQLTIQRLREVSELDPVELSTTLGNLKKGGLMRIAPGGLLKLTSDEIPADLDQIQRSLEKVSGFQPIELNKLEEVAVLIEQYQRDWGKTRIFKFQEKKSRRFGLSRFGQTLIQQLPSVEPSIQEVSRLGPAMLKDGSWRTQLQHLRKYNINLRPPRTVVGRKHPYRQFLDFVKYKLVSIGFEEMLGPLVETEFWNMDALYMPQFHPARDIHDVYFVKEQRPTGLSGRQAEEIEEPYLSQVRATHQNGWKTGSKGWNYVFDSAQAARKILRSQGTAVSARTLAHRPKIPGKYFAIARCFRYDLVDATHATDFFQIEGIVLDRGIHFRALLGLLELFAKEVAKAQEVRFVPAYFPYTEPSVELHVKHPKLGWMELGGAGLFRPEVTLPLGVKVPVIAWGLGLDRMAMVALDIHDIRDLFTADLEMIRAKRVASL